MNANILDAGAGFGQYTYWLYTKSWTFNITSVDVKDEQVDDCNKFFDKIGALNDCDRFIPNITAKVW